MYRIQRKLYEKILLLYRYKLRFIIWYTHAGNSSLPDSRFLRITSDNPPTSAVPLIVINNMEPNIMKVWKKSVHTTALRPPWIK